MTAPEQMPSEATRMLQTYLRQVSYDTAGMTRPPINGFFGPATERALSEFQASRDLPVTGEADEETWDALFAAYRASLTANAPRVRMDIFPRSASGTTLDVGSRGFAVAAIQYMLMRLEEKYGSIGSVAVNGEFTEETARAVMAFRHSNGLPENGTVTEALWDTMAAQYNVLFTEPERY